jgi:hypothetical protein
VALLDGWDELSGAERRERSVSLLGESSKSKGYKLAKKYQLVDVGGVIHVLTRAGDDDPLVEGGGEGMEGPLPSADGPKRLVSEGDMFDVLWDTHVLAGGHCKGRAFEV